MPARELISFRLFLTGINAQSVGVRPSFAEASILRSKTAKDETAGRRGERPAKTGNIVGRIRSRGPLGNHA